MKVHSSFFCLFPSVLVLCGCGSERVGSTTAALSAGEREIVVRSGPDVRSLSYGHAGDVFPAEADFIAAQANPVALVDRASVYISSLPDDPDAVWIATDPARSPVAALYAVPFDVTEKLIDSATLRLRYAVDNALNGVWINGKPISNNPYDGDYHQQFGVDRSDIGPLLIPNAKNWLYLNVSDYGVISALLFSARITVVGSSQPMSVRPTRAGNLGAATLRILGFFPETPSAVKLVANGQPDLLARAVAKKSETAVEATFDLGLVEPGQRDVVVEVPGRQPQVLAAAFEIVAGGGGKLEVSVIGPSTMRVGRPTAFLTVVRNSGLNDIGPVLASTTFTAEGSSASSRAAALAAPVGPITIPIVPPGSSITLPADFVFQGCGSVHAEAEDPCADKRRLVNELRNRQIMLINQLSDLNRELAGCVRDPDRILRGECVAIQQQITALEIELALVDAQLAAAEQALRECEGNPQGSASTAGGTASVIVSADHTACPIFSWDPNDKVGPGGAGDARYLAGLDPFAYTIFYENKASATAPAQEVRVTDVLPPDLDWSTLVFGAIRVGSRTIEPPADAEALDLSVDLRPERNLILKIQAGLDAILGELNWRFSSLDPVTGQPTEDPLAGFLPPNLAAPEGEGSVSFRMLPKADLASGVVIANGASIVFDTNAPILTPIWSNTVDRTPPASQVAPLPATSSSPSFPVSWTASDEHSGVKDVSVFVATDDGPRVQWLAETTATSGLFTGARGHKYAFYAVARDKVGNAEDAPSVAGAVTVVAADGAPPVTSARLTPEPKNGWLTTDAVVNLVSDDGPEGSGVREIVYAASGATVIPRTTVPGAFTSFSLAAEGTTTIEFFSVDVAGNVETPQTIVVRVDKTPPAMRCRVHPSVLSPADGRFVPVRVEVFEGDAGSGAAGFLLTGVSSDEPGAGHDIRGFRIGTADLTGELRAVRARHRDGRRYVLRYAGFDQAGNRAQCELLVAVPRGGYSRY